MQSAQAELVEALRSSQRVTVLTGAGTSAESGVPTFRDALTGLWSKYDPQQLATPEAFERDAELVTRWYDERRCNVARCAPNAGHVALARLQRIVCEWGGTFALITQNVDRLHQVAGSTDVIELHGTLWSWRCTSCNDLSEERGPAFTEFPPRCRACNGVRRPGVVWFGESLPREALLAAERASRASDVFISIGTSSVVYPAAGLIDLAIDSGAKVAEINMQSTAVSGRVNWSIMGKSGEVLPVLVDQILENKGN